MKVNFNEIITHEMNIKIVDIDVVSEEETLLFSSRRKIRYGLARSTSNARFYVGTVLTLSDCNLPVGTEFEIPRTGGVSKWTIFVKDKAFSMTSFDPDEYTEDEAKLKVLLRKWADSNGIKFGE